MTLQEILSQCLPFILVIWLFSEVVMPWIDLKLIGLFPIRCDVYYYRRSTECSRGHVSKGRSTHKQHLLTTFCIPGMFNLVTCNNNTLQIRCIYGNWRYLDSSELAWVWISILVKNFFLKKESDYQMLEPWKSPAKLVTNAESMSSLPCLRDSDSQTWIGSLKIYFLTSSSRQFQ